MRWTKPSVWRVVGSIPLYRHFGSHIRGLNSHGVTAIKDQEVTQEDVERVIEAAQVVAIPTDQKILQSCRGNSLSMVRKAFRTRSACPGCGWRRGCIS